MNLIVLSAALGLPAAVELVLGLRLWIDRRALRAARRRIAERRVRDAHRAPPAEPAARPSGRS